MKKFTTYLFEGRLQVTLIAFFILVTIITIGVGSLVINRVINDYLVSAEDDQVARDMELAMAFYQLKLDEISGISRRLSLDSFVRDNLADAIARNRDAMYILDQQIINKISLMGLGGTHLIAILDAEGNLVSGRVLAEDGRLSPQFSHGNWGDLPIMQTTLQSKTAQGATEIIPVEYLELVGLANQASIQLIETQLAALQPYDDREGHAGLALVGIEPILETDGHLAGAVLTAYLFNNDFTLVDRIKQVAGVDTVTIFFGDLRISTNVLNLDGSRAVGTRVSQTVYDNVLIRGLDYKGEAFVVNDWYITRYTPLRDHQKQVVGILYVGANRAAFDQLVNDFTSMVAMVALICIVLAGMIALPISRRIIRPITDLVEANRKLAAGDMNIQVEPVGRGELAMLGNSFNTMVQTLRQAQQELLHKEKLASVGQLAAGVAHEINNPLGTILLFADMVRNETPKESAHYSDLEMILNETNRCKRIVANLLNFSRQQEMLTQEVDLNRVIELVIDTVVHRPIFEGVEFVRQYAQDLPLVQADPAQLQQVFSNLVDNAAEALPEGGTITITTRIVDEQCVEVQIADTGLGIAEENQRKLFTPFFTTKPTGKGTGLGLSIVYGIIKMHRGQISVSSKEGEGSTFTILLPIRQPATTLIDTVNETE